MNNVFNIKRFGLLINKDLQENGKRYLLSSLTLFGIMAIILTLTSWTEYSDNPLYDIDYYNRKQLTNFTFLFAAFGLFFASTAMNLIDSKTKRIAYLSLPSSNFEKYFSRWLIVTIGYIVVFFIALWLADLLRVLICSIKFPKAEFRMLDYSKLVYTENDGQGYGLYVFNHSTIFGLVLSIYFLFQSIFLLGTLFWQKNSFIKTFSFSAIIIVLFILICRWVILAFYTDFNSFGNVIESLVSQRYQHYSEEKMPVIVTFIFSCFTLINWVIAYFRFKESEIIKRL